MDEHALEPETDEIGKKYGTVSLYREGLGVARWGEQRYDQDLRKN